MKISQSNIFLLRFLRKWLPLFTPLLLFSCQNEKNGPLDNLPSDIINSIIGYVHPEFEIAAALNPNRYFGNYSSKEILKNLGIVKRMGIALACTSSRFNQIFDNHLPTHKTTVPDGYTQYLSYLASQEGLFGSHFDENKKIFCFSQGTKKVLLKNLAFLFFGLDNKAIHLDAPIINPPFYEPFAFALTIMDYEGFNSDHKYVLKDEKEPYIESEKSLLKSFFKNTKSLHKRLAILNIPIEISIFMADYFRLIAINNRFEKKIALEAFFENGIEAQKEFLFFLKNKSRVIDLCLDRLLFLEYEEIHSTSDLMNIMESFIKAEYKFGFWFISPEDRLEILIAAADFCKTFTEQPKCTDCNNAQTAIIQKVINSKKLWYEILNSLINVRTGCLHNLFNEHLLVNFIRRHSPNANSEALLRIISLLRKYPTVKYPKGPFMHSCGYVFDQYSNVFKKLVLLTEYLEHINSNDACIACINSNTTLLERNIEKIYTDDDDESDFWKELTREAFKIKKGCEHPLFDERHIKFLKNLHPSLDEQSLLKIVHCLSKTEYMKKICEWWQHLFILDPTSITFKKLLYLADHYEQETMQEKIHSLMTKEPKYLDDNILFTACYQPQSFNFERIMVSLNCLCNECTLMKNKLPEQPTRKRPLAPLLKKIFLGVIGIAVGCIFIRYLFTILKQRIIPT